VATVAVTNTGSTSVNVWDVALNIGKYHRIIAAWNAQTFRNGKELYAKNYSYNGVLAPGQSTTFGFQGSFYGAYEAPSCQ